MISESFCFSPLFGHNVFNSLNFAIASAWQFEFLSGWNSNACFL
jgi:hypothetical protein